MTAKKRTEDIVDLDEIDEYPDEEAKHQYSKKQFTRILREYNKFLRHLLRLQRWGE